ncbi:MAG: rhodanese-like domain-containing protein [Deinococcota bacterium]|jgi:rhodanese-related sulfurtransferase|nr:rhodanese-like domain-containing protein [Deinococcota bacterium]
MSQTPEIDVHETQARMQDGALLLDVRERDEYDALRIPGATLLSLSEFEGRYEELPRDQEIVVHCRSGRRSMQAADYLNERGYNAVNVLGGILAWQEAGLPVEEGQDG